MVLEAMTNPAEGFEDHMRALKGAVPSELRGHVLTIASDHPALRDNSIAVKLPDLTALIRYLFSITVNLPLIHIYVNVKCTADVLQPEQNSR